MMIDRGPRCSEPGCRNYAEVRAGQNGLCKPCEDEKVYERVYGSDLSTRRAERAAAKREAEDAVAVTLMAPPKVSVLAAQRLIEEMAR